MHGFSGLDLAFLEGAEVIQVRLGRWQVQLHFGNAATVSIECAFVHHSEAGDRTIFEHGAPLGANELYRLLGQTWTRAETPASDQLMIQFSGGDLLLLRDTPDYESLQVNSEDHQIIV